ncbi:MAG: F0F1 ATP synthase subunit A [Clostridiales bacterium]|nr:F0F1 ATP synthase subunit A [Clostridiales bacterium]
MNTAMTIKLSVSAFIFAVMLVLHVFFKKRGGDADPKKDKRRRRLTFYGMVFSGWFFVAATVNMLTGGGNGLDIPIELLSMRKTLFGVSFAETTLTSFMITAVVLVLALIFRFAVFPKFADEPKGFQSVIETLVEAMDNFVKGIAGDLSDELSAYMFTVAVYLIGCAVAELLGSRSPASDLETTFSMALITFTLINYYGIKKKRLSGRIKSLASPSPMILPMKMVSDLAFPVSLSCRLFGNMLGGMIVMDLMKSALGGYAVGFSALAGIYFNLFHPLIQAYIFIVLSLTFIREATE